MVICGVKTDPIKLIYCDYRIKESAIRREIAIISFFLLELANRLFRSKNDIEQFDENSLFFM